MPEAHWPHWCCFGEISLGEEAKERETEMEMATTLEYALGPCEGRLLVFALVFAGVGALLLHPDSCWHGV